MNSTRSHGAVRPPWTTRLFSPVDGASLAVARIAFGVFVAIDAWRYLGYGWVRQYYIEPEVHFTYLYLDFVRPWPGEGMLVHYGVTSLLGLCTAAGWHYRLTAPLLFLSYLYIFLLEQSVYMNHHYLMVLLAGLLACMPAERVASLDRRRRPELPQTVPFWCVGLLRFQLALVYGYGAIAKLNADWLAGEPMLSSIRDGSAYVPAVAAWIPPEIIAYGIAYGGIAVDASLPILLLWPRLHWLGFPLAIAFHLLNAIFLHIGVFSWLMMALVTIFFAPDWPRRWLPVSAVVCRETPQTRSWVIGLLGLYVTLQLLVPLRHWLFPGDVAWTEEGHRFAWRMKLRGKESEVRLRARDPQSGREWEIDPAADLIPRQHAKLGTFPDILLQYVHYHRDRLRAQGIEAQIFVDWRCSLNGAPALPLVDPSVDLARVERSWRPATWLLARPVDEAR